MKHQLFIVSQNAVIRSPEGKILLLRHKGGLWLLPGGRLEADEGVLTGLRREIKEETGLENFNIICALTLDVWNGAEHCPTYGVTFLCTTDHPGPITLSDEHTSYRWITALDLPHISFFNPQIAFRVAKAFEQRGCGDQTEKAS
jgi:8-oxo-dGTP pyrophosphatase MutT (NUDIX family)